ncbi:MAG: hypothetical protein JO285_13575, partial [Kutzneria sp.]|nr:hypothetical protein [Kutzneria sp.]
AVSTSGNVFLVGTAVGASWPPLALLPAYLALFAQAIVYNVFFALTDIDGDRSVGWKTLPVRRGVDTTIMVLTGLLMVQLGCAAIVPLWIGHTTALPAYLTLVAVSALLSAGAVRTLVLASRPLRRVVALRAVEYCLLDRVVLPAAFVILVDGVMPVGAVLLVALVSTWWASRTLLYRHEIGRHRPSGDGPPSGAVPRVVG